MQDIEGLHIQERNAHFESDKGVKNGNLIRANAQSHQQWRNPQNKQYQSEQKFQHNIYEISGEGKSLLLDPSKKQAEDGQQ